MRVTSRTISRVSALALALAIVQPGTALAQDADESEAADDKSEIVVTGTSIRGAPPVGSALIQLGRAEIESTAAATTTQIIRELPQVFNFGVTDAARNQSGGAGNIVYGSSINIRGIGPFATLTLLNGRRPVPQGTLGASVDPGNIPAIALERIEIIADGASAVYGSDAVAGVANLILRRNFKGIGLDASYGWIDDSKEHAVNGIVGHDWGSGRFTLAGQRTFRSALSGLDRDFYQSNLTAFGGGDARVTQCSPGNIQVGATTYAIPAGGPTPTNLIAGSANRCDNIKTTDILPEQKTTSASFTFDQEVAEGISFFVDALWAKREGVRRSAAPTATLAVPATNPFFVAPAGVTLPNCAAAVGAPAGTRCLNVLYSYSGVLGPNSFTEITSKVWQVTAGVDFEMSEKWHLNAYATYGYNRDHAFSYNNATDAPNLAAALRATDPALAFNPFGTPGGNSAAVLAGVFNNLTDTDGKTWFTDAGIKVDGSLFTLPGGDVKVAVGSGINGFRLRTGQIRGREGAQTGTDQRLHRNFTSFYGELMIPIFGPDNAVPGFQSLTLNLAGRIDQYSDVGTTKNPKFGINWEPFADLKLHGSYGESFRAPLLTNLVSAGGSQLFIQPYFDPKANNGVGASVNGIALSGGNLDLTPETARTWSFGFDYTPSAMPGARLSLNYFDLVYEGQIISYLSNLNLLRQEALFGSILLRGTAGQARVQQLINEGRPIASGRTVAEALAAGANVFVDGRTNNLGLTKSNGIDFGLVVPFQIGNASTLRFSLNGARFLKYKVALTPGGQILDQLNNIDYPLKLRARAGLGFDSGGLNANVYVNYQNGYNNTFSVARPRIKANTTVDAALSYDLGDLMPLAKQLKLGVNVINLFDKDPPFADIAPNNNGGGGFDPTTSSPLGRVISVSLRSRF